MEYIAFKTTAGVEISRMDIVRGCIQYQVDNIVYGHLPFDSELTIAIMNQWNQHFENVYKYETDDFHILTVKSKRASSTLCT
jgi:hypothetical protein